MEKDKEVANKAIKRGLDGRTGFPNLKDAVKNRSNLMRIICQRAMVSQRFNPFKKVQMN